MTSRLETGLRIKICGLTRLEDAALATELGAFALGFVFYPPSPRAMEPEAAKRIIAALPETSALADKLWKVGVFVNSDYDTLAGTAAIAGLTHLQLHGDESPELCARLAADGYQVIKALRLRTEADLRRVDDFPDPVLIDAAVPGVWGGSGQRADWELASRGARRKPVLLAGGLNPANVAAALSTVRPWGLDLSSGVESAPGIKDSIQLQTLFTKARDTHANPDRP